MKKLTKKQRWEIYLIAAVAIAEGEDSACCWELAIAMGRQPQRFSAHPEPLIFPNELPEIFLFCPKGVGESDNWFGDVDVKENQQARIDALLFCIAMCE